jgi:hypothetical protein
MIIIEEEKIAKLMMDVWHKSAELRNPVEAAKWIAGELSKVECF